jgi:alpha-tubulin suppressor-like RCC1 family protein
VFANFNHSCALTCNLYPANGHLFLWGESLSPPLRRGVKQVELDLQPGDQAVKVDFCRKSAILCTKGGYVYTWGDNTYGELGLPQVRRADVPQCVPNLTEIIDIAAGARHALVLSSQGVIYAFGDNSEGQCARDDSIQRGIGTVTARNLMGTETLQTKFIFASESQSAMVSTAGDLLLWGDNSQGRLGDSQNSLSRPTLVDEFISKKVCAVGLGHQFTVILTGPTGAAMALKKRNAIRLSRSVEPHRRSFPSNVRLGEQL